MTDAERERDAHAARLRGLLYLACPDAPPEGIEITAKAIAESTDDDLPHTAVPQAAHLTPHTENPSSSRPLNLFKAALAYTDLSGADLSGADLSGADLSGADLSGADLSGADLSGADLSGADLNAANLSDANLTNTFFISAVWSVGTTWPQGVVAQMRDRSSPIRGGRWKVQGSGNSGADVEVSPVA